MFYIGRWPVSREALHVNYDNVAQCAILSKKSDPADHVKRRTLLSLVVPVRVQICFAWDNELDDPLLQTWR